MSTVYKTAGEQSLQLDILTPKGLKTNAAPLLMYIHGGGWGGGDRYRMTKADVSGVFNRCGYSAFRTLHSTLCILHLAAPPWVSQPPPSFPLSPRGTSGERVRGYGRCWPRGSWRRSCNRKAVSAGSDRFCLVVCLLVLQNLRLPNDFVSKGDRHTIRRNNTGAGLLDRKRGHSH